MVEQPPQYTIDHLTKYIQLMIHLTGEEPKEVRVSQEFFNWYREYVKRIAKNFNIQNANLKDNEQEFMGVKLIARLDIK